MEEAGKRKDSDKGEKKKKNSQKDGGTKKYNKF